MKKKYNKPIIQIIHVRNEMNFCSSIYETKDVKVMGHEVGSEHSFSIGIENNDLVGKETDNGTGKISWE